MKEMQGKTPHVNLGRGVFLQLNGGGLCLGRVDFDAALEVGAVLDADARRGNVTDDRAIPLDVHAATRDDVANDFTEDDHVAGLNFGMEMSRRAHGEFMSVERDGTVHFTVDLQVFFPDDMSLDLQAGTQTGRLARAGTAKARRRGCVEWDNR